MESRPSETNIREVPDVKSRTLGDYLAVLRRRRRIVIQAAIIVPIAAFLVSVVQDRVYGASAEVLISQQNFGYQLRSLSDPGVVSDPVRFAQTQADLARSPELAGRIVRAAKIPGFTARDLLRASSVTPKVNSDLLVFKVKNTDRGNASRLADAYARQFTLFRRELDTITLKRAKAQLQRRIRTASRAERPELVSLLEELKLVEALQTSNTFLVRPAGRADQVVPRPSLYVTMGAFLGLILGIALAFILEALDKRVRSEEEIEERLGMYLLGRIPKPPERVTEGGGLVMLNEPNGADAEAFRVLRTNLEFVNLDRGAQTIMVTSATRGEGKSMTVANLAIAFARAGKRVALVDLDVRMPTVHKLMKVRQRPGITDVVLGSASLDAAISVVSDVAVLPAGFAPPNPGEFVGFRDVADVLDQLKSRVDVVFVDTPPILVVGDALTLTATIDAVMVVTQMNVRRPELIQLRRALEKSPATNLGFVVTGATPAEGTYGYIVDEVDESRSAVVSPAFGKSGRRGSSGEPAAEDPAPASERWQIRDTL